MTMFGEANVEGIILEEEDQVKLKYLTVVMPKGCKANQLLPPGSNFLTREMIAGVATWWRPSIVPLLIQDVKWSIRRPELLVFLLAVLISKGVQFALPSLPRLFIRSNA